MRAVSTEAETGTGGVAGGRVELGPGLWGPASLARREVGRQADHGGGAGLWPEGRNQVFHSVSVGLVWPAPQATCPTTIDSTSGELN